MIHNSTRRWQSRFFSLVGLIVVVLGAHLAQGQTPTITGLSPARNQRSTPASSQVAVTFSQAMQNSAATQQAVRVFSHQRGGMMFGANRGSATVSGNTVSFDPATDFLPGETVYVTTTMAATATNGTPLSQGHVHQFTVAVAPTGVGEFRGTQRLSVGGVIGPAKMADIDNDGDLDMLVTNYNSAAIAIFYNDGAGSFNGNYNVPLGNYPGDLTLGDVNGDGNLDLVVACPNVGAVSVCLSNGNGTFGGTQNVVIGTSPSAVTLGDVDGDGDLDMLTTNSSAGTVSVRYNNGNGVFTGTQTVNTGPVTSSVKLADWDADGDLDLTVANRLGASVNLWSNDGTGNFAVLNTQSPSNWRPSDVAIGDLNADGYLDFMVPTYPLLSGVNKVSVRLSVGGSYFQPAPDVNLISPATGLTLGDVDGDGDLDLFAFGDSVSVFLNDGAGQFSSGFVVNVGANPVRAVELADVDADGDLDLLATTSMGVSVRLNTPAPPMAITGILPARNQVNAPRATSVAVTFNQPLLNTVSSRQALRIFSHQRGGLIYGTRDGTATASGNTLAFDPVIGFRPGETVAVTTTIGVAANGYGLPSGHVYQFTAAVGGTGQGNTWNAPSLPNVGGASSLESVATGDIDGDGDLDFVSSGTRVSVRRNNGFGLFSGTQDVNINNRAIDVALADVDGDGDLDVLTSNLGNSGDRVSTLLNDGTGTFTIGSHVGVSGLPNKLQVGDLDGDGDLDLVCASFNNTVYVRLNDGNGVFTGTQEVNGGGGNGRVELGDIDGDGDLDIVAPDTDSTTNAVSVHLNNGTGTFIGGSTVYFMVNIWAIALGDVDADGNLDLLALGGGGGVGRLVIRHNDGTGVFGPSQDFVVNIDANSIKLGDVDADGDLDVLLPITYDFYPLPGQVTGLRNDGTGVFSTNSANRFGAGTATNPVALVLGDLDGDGDLDMLTANNGASSVSVRLNDGTGPQVGLPADAASTAITLSPNPVPAGASVRLTGLGAATAISLLDATGRQLGILQADATGAATLPVAPLCQGLYLLHAADGRTWRLVVE